MDLTALADLFLISGHRSRLNFVVQHLLGLLQMPGTNEGNVYATSGRDYVAAKAWLITAAGALFVEAFLLFGALNA
jgi:hypothetical protein